MNKQLTKYALAALITGVPIATLPMGFEATLDGDGVKVNGQKLDEPSVGYTVTSIGLQLGGAYAASRLIKPDHDPNMQLATILTGSTVGAISADVLCGRGTPRRIFELTGRATGTLLGAIAHEEGGSYIKDTAALGGHLGSALISQVYGDTEQAKLHLSKAAGEQLGMCLFPDDQKETGRALGVNIGAAMASEKKYLRDFYLKKAAVQTVSVQTVKRVVGTPTSILDAAVHGWAANTIANMIVNKTA